jgi:hypothetical protein
MLRKCTILSLFLLFSFSLFAQDNGIHKKSPISKLETKSSVLNMKSSVGKKNELQSLFYVLPSDGYYGGGNYAPWAPTCYMKYERCVYLITAAEIQALGIPSGVNVNEIAWTYAIEGGGTTNAAGTMKIYLQNTTDLTFNKSTAWATAITGMTLVDNNPSWTLTTTALFKSEVFSLPTAFTYTGGGIYVAFDLQNNSGVSTTYYQSPNITSVAAGGGSISCEYRQNATAAPTTMITTNGAYRAETYLGFDIANDLEVYTIYTYGKLPIPYAVPHQIIAPVSNNGNSTKHNFNVTLNITGANPHSEVVTIDSLQAGYYTEVAFTSWSPANTGTNTITVSVPSDDINANNSKSVNQLITFNSYTYAYGPFPATQDGGVGFTGATGDFVAKFHSASASNINQVAVNFDAGGQPFKMVIWDATGTGGVPGSFIWESAALTSTAGLYTLLVSPAVAVSGDFYVGVRQTGTANVSFAYQVESPVRYNTFYFTSPTGGTTWNDFAPGNDFRFMIEPRLAIANDVGASTIDAPVGGSVHHLTNYPLTPQAHITNYGFSTQTSLSATMKIFDAANSQVYTSTKVISSLASSTSTLVTFDATSFTPTAQTYTAKCYTSLAGDADKSNDTVSASFDYTYWEFDLGAFFQAYTKTDGTGMNYAYPSVTVELRDASTFALVESQTSSVNTGGIGLFNFVSPLDATPYYIVVKTPNTLETWSANPHVFTNSYLFYNFVSADTQSYGNNVIQIGTAWCIYSGDVNQDGFITSDDYSGVDNDNFNYDYHFVNDVNGDGFITSDDYTTIDNNNFNYIQKMVPPGAPGHLVKRSVKNHVQ